MCDNCTSSLELKEIDATRMMILHQLGNFTVALNYILDTCMFFSLYFYKMVFLGDIFLGKISFMYIYTSIVSMTYCTDHTKIIVSLLHDIQLNDQRATLLQLVDKFKAKWKDLGELPPTKHPFLCDSS
jgi:hypothetical protein